MRLLFLRATGLGFAVAEPDEILDIEDAGLVRNLLNSGQAIPAPGEDAPDDPQAITSADLGAEPQPGPKPRSRK